MSKLLSELLNMNEGKGYASLTLNNDATKQIKDILSELNIEGAINHLHLTTMYDSSNPKIKVDCNPSKEYTATITGSEMLGMRDSKWYAFTLILDCPEIIQLHENYKQLGFKHSYPDFLPHMSLIYRPSEEEIKKIEDNFDKFKNIKLTFYNETFEKIKEGD